MCPMNKIPYQDLTIFSKLINDYLKSPENLKTFYDLYPEIENFENQIKKKSISYKNRELLMHVLFAQNKDCAKNISETLTTINQSNTFTVTTGHQLNLFMGPLYFFYKIISVIKSCNALKVNYPNYNFVPVFWLASEDHDFDEINHFNFGDKKILWQKEVSGPVGRLKTEKMEEVLNEINNFFPNNEHGQKLKDLFKEAYFDHDNLKDATRFLVNHFFAEKGLIIIDGDDINLKKLMIPIIKEDIIEQSSFKKITETNQLLTDYHIQINPREINWFYILDGLRERIVFQNETYFVINTPIKFSKNELLDEINNHPERFSPNALLRPLYQEVVLPNLAYVGGAAEVAYWLQLKSTFDHYQVTFPIVMLRNHAIILTEMHKNKLKKYDLKIEELFINEVDLLKTLTKRYSKSNVDFRRLREILNLQFDELYEVVKHTDQSFKGAVLAEKTRQLKSLDKLEKRFWKAEKKQHEDKIKRVLDLKAELFPKSILQERVHNFSTYHAIYGDEIFKKMYESFEPFAQVFDVIEI